ncbi:anaplastic lymphoma kinase [Dermatophagoides farinae]|uniref:anaplastic lymphoma kinase n=1 Tax=Dermatophagoides farinae TaxID=6954 RepID=UPI001F0E5CA9|nr:leukocyte tyrosine kinase receptor-like [Dermatophagoides farinae]
MKNTIIVKIKSFNIVLIFIVDLLLAINSQNILEKINCDFNDATLCNWILNNNNGIAQFQPMFNHTDLFFDDYEKNNQEKILVVRPNPQTDIVSIKSPTLYSSDYDYEFSFQVNMNFFGFIQIVIRQEQIESQILKIKGDRDQKWKTYSVGMPRYHKMNILLEIKFLTINSDSDYIALNYVKIIDKQRKSETSDCEYQCHDSNYCLSNQSICNIFKDCPFGDDEQQNCDLLPPGSYCNFDHDFCSWFNYDEPNSSGQWIHLANGSDSGSLGVVFKGVHKFALISYLKSPLFDSIPLYHSITSSNYFNSCKIHFSYIFHTISIDLALELEPYVDNNDKHKPIQLWRFFNNKLSSKWANVTVTLPANFHHRYRLKFGVALGLKSTSTFGQKVYVAIDNFSLTKSCFGIDVPENERRIPLFIPGKEQDDTEKFFSIPRNKSITAFTFTSCGATGNLGPTYTQCELFYLNSSTRAAVFEKNKNLNLNLNINGTQMWIVPKTGYYTIIAKGGNGGRGLYDHPGGLGSLVRAIFHFQEGDTIFLVIGHSGSNVCSEFTNNFDQCKYPGKNSKISIGGGGGGATYIFKLNPNSNLNDKWEPLLIAGGGGGGNGKFNPNFKLSSAQHGRGFDIYNLGYEGTGDGAGGGWNTSTIIQNNQTGQSLLYGAVGGIPCPRLSKWRVTGGFGGGGGSSCQFAGGGGGGFNGGNVNKPYDAGDGGTSYVAFNQSFLQSFSNPNMLSLSEQEEIPANGFAMIIPQIDNCCNDGQFSCLITGEFQNITNKYCICGHEKFIPDSCVYEPPRYELILWAALFIISVALILITFILIVFQRRNSKKKQQPTEPSDMYLLSNSDSTDLQLSRLRSHNIITEYNPNYEFGGSTCTLGDLREIQREKLNLVKALGQGAFGEVYQGFLHNMPDETNDELPVAVKTLPEYSANKQAEMDFLMEALIMSKFHHRNIVRFIGICFEKMPRFIILELLSGGDLRTFLRENRSVAEKPSTLVMGDLLVMALDVACGCQYLEANHFIHRDIAARNCLLTSKIKMNLNGNTNQTFNSNGNFDLNNYKNGFNNSGIVVKIADFGMARDIYRANYYRKGGKAMLPVKWMPPEAFLDGIFTSKTDVWSFGVLLWEVMSMGYLPYPGRGNQEVMQLVTAGGRLECPNSLTPPLVYDIMMQCWNASPELRPNFTTIIDSIGNCLRDPNILNVPLPIFHRSASMEKDTTLMRPPPDATDYLIPNNFGSQTNSNYSVATEKTELLSPDTCSTLSCNNDDHNKNFDTIDSHNHVHHDSTSILNPNSSYNFDYLNQRNPYNSEIILDPNRFNNQNPSVRYVNVNVNNSMVQNKNI